MASPLRIVIDTNVIVAALWSKRGASNRLLTLLGDQRFVINLSVPLLIEYEEATKRLAYELELTYEAIDDILNYINSASEHRSIFYLWRSFLRDKKDELVLEVAVESESRYIVTYNKRDFVGVENFGIQVVTPAEFLQIIGEGT
ncbi:MAG: putative toxin-antitoxin system toxin component, PIN family [Bacteroidetes bacterium]|nr:putative toxin-antitoxin system toxin component, PIN family [Bacteroidota bacterium]MCW5895572.1 putative toxin-antitoxin system toxin component, PIN family [Bacteroidota bacterium]